MRENLQANNSVEATISVPRINISSNTIGSAIARENGHPIMAPAANNTVVINVRCCEDVDGGSNAYAKASEFIYIANEEGKKAKSKA